MRVCIFSLDFSLGKLLHPCECFNLHNTDNHHRDQELPLLYEIIYLHKLLPVSYQEPSVYKSHLVKPDQTQVSLELAM